MSGEHRTQGQHYVPMPPSPADGPEDTYALKVADFLRVRPDEWSPLVKEIVHRSFMEGWSPEGAGERAINASYGGGE